MVTEAGQHTTLCNHRQNQEIEPDEELGRICYGSYVDSGALPCLSTMKHLLVLRQMRCGVRDCDQCSPGYPYFEPAVANIAKCD